MSTDASLSKSDVATVATPRLESADSRLATVLGTAIAGGVRPRVCLLARLSVLRQLLDHDV